MQHIMRSCSNTPFQISAYLRKHYKAKDTPLAFLQSPQDLPYCGRRSGLCLQATALVCLNKLLDRLCLFIRSRQQSISQVYFMSRVDHRKPDVLALTKLLSYSLQFNNERIMRQFMNMIIATVGLRLPQLLCESNSERQIWQYCKLITHIVCSSKQTAYMWVVSLIFSCVS